MREGLLFWLLSLSLLGFLILAFYWRFRFYLLFESRNEDEILKGEGRGRGQRERAEGEGRGRGQRERAEGEGEGRGAGRGQETRRGRKETKE